MRLLIVSDIHANWPALEAVLQAEPTPDAIAFCGDVVDYGPHPVKCVRWVSANATHLVRGNHDNALGEDVGCGCEKTYRQYSMATRAWHRTLLDVADLEFLRSMPLRQRFEWGGKTFRMAHATPQGELFEYLEPREWSSHVAGIQEDYVLLGHTHVKGMRTIGTITVVNPGSVGLARDYPGEAGYALCEDGHVELKRVRYAVERVAASLRCAPLSTEVIEGLAGVLGASGPASS